MIGNDVMKSMSKFKIDKVMSGLDNNGFLRIVKDGFVDAVNVLYDMSDEELLMIYRSDGSRVKNFPKLSEIGLYGNLIMKLSMMPKLSVKVMIDDLQVRADREVGQQMIDDGKKMIEDGYGLIQGGTSLFYGI